MAAWVEWARSNWLLIAFVLGLTLVFFVLRTQPTAGINSLSSLDAALSADQPAVLEFYSNF
jgi:hypothetical protein